MQSKTYVVPYRGTRWKNSVYLFRKTVNSVRKVVNLFSKLTVNHIRKRVENCQPKSGKDNFALHRCSVAVPKQII